LVFVAEVGVKPRSIRRRNFIFKSFGWRATTDWESKYYCWYHKI